MTNPYYTPSGNPATSTRGVSSLIRTEYQSIQTAFDKMPTWTAKGGYIVRVKATEDGLEAVNSLGGITLEATVTGVTQTAGDNSTKLATTEYVDQRAFSTALPSQTGNSGKVITTNGTNASWSLIGTANQYIRVNSAGTALEGTDPPVGSILYTAQFSSL